MKLIAGIGLLLLSTTSPVLPSAAAVDNIATNQLPQAVTRSIENAYKGAQILSAEKDSERNDYIYYFVKIRLAGEIKQLEINENGTISPPVTAGK